MLPRRAIPLVGVLSVMVGAPLAGGVSAEPPAIRDTFSDTWVATDGLGRQLPTFEEVGPPRQDRFVALFYFIWLGEHVNGGPYDISRILAEDPDAMRKADSPLWGPLGAFHHWGEPLFGYYTADDAYVLRKHAQMLSDAGVDAIIFDTTNQITYRRYYMALLEAFAEVRRNGGQTPQVAFLCPFGDPSDLAPGNESRFSVGIGLMLGAQKGARSIGQKRHVPEESIQKLRRAEVELAQGATVAEACRKIEVTEHTYYRWRSQCRSAAACVWTRRSGQKPWRRRTAG